jgi:hypothetical protein
MLLGYSACHLRNVAWGSYFFACANVVRVCGPGVLSFVLSVDVFCALRRKMVGWGPGHRDGFSWARDVAMPVCGVSGFLGARATFARPVGLWGFVGDGSGLSGVEFVLGKFAGPRVLAVLRRLVRSLPARGDAAFRASCVHSPGWAIKKNKALL